ncbi:hypothetical protein TWF481_000764 [Arthrobotrys musiformis]|uniref:Sarcolemma associated protein a n=1 Tax=Arthrobotrys musiformis TaxID=47236 RepID=A0AAV9WQC7_9PEZI
MAWSCSITNSFDSASLYPVVSYFFLVSQCSAFWFKALDIRSEAPRSGQVDFRIPEVILTSCCIFCGPTVRTCISCVRLIMAQANGRFTDTDPRTEGAAYQNELERLTRLIWNLEEPIESSNRCIRELKSRRHVLSDEEQENLKSEEMLLQKLETDLQKLGEQRDDLKSTPAGLRAQEMARLQQEIDRSIKPFSPEEIAERAKSFRQQAEKERSSSSISNFIWGGGVAIMMLVPAVAAVLWSTSTTTTTTIS